ncbi:MAG: hypothetical protein QF654_11655 [Alphaproteobacteria bacterium]|nr:hypothetical protein [Alphaproteobacteria bacterium]
MRLTFLKAATVGLALVLAGAVAATAETQFPKPRMTNADDKTNEEFRQFYEEIEAALKSEDVEKIMSFYSDDYLHHGITKKQLKFMWLEVFTNFDDLYSVHVFTKITVAGSDAILVCTGGLFGIARKGDDYTTVDQWVAQPHWVTKEAGKWKMIGGATHGSPRRRGGRMELHPFF